MMIEDGPWTQGINSSLDPLLIQQGAYQWSTNTINRGGRIQTRPSYRMMTGNFINDPDSYHGQGGAIFTPKTGTPLIVVARGGLIFYKAYPFYPASWADGSAWQQVSGLQFSPDEMIHMEVTVKATDYDNDGNVVLLDEPYSLLMISDGVTRTASWDGVTAKHLDPSDNKTPVCSWMKWIGNRLWVASGKKVIASDLLNPTSFVETNAVSSGGFFVLPSECTGLGTTVDFKKLLAFTDETTTSIQSGISDRAAWAATPEFQAVIFPTIGCAAGRTIINQYGMTWWLSHGGWIGLDVAVQTYRTSKIHYGDSNMARSKANLSPDISGACATAYENFVLISVPSGHITNAHTWVMDQGVVDTLDQISPPAWASTWTGISPVHYMTGVIEGKLRCFAVGYKLGHVWELFCSDPFDSTLTPHGLEDTPFLGTVPIQASMETRLLGNSDTTKLFDYAELELDEIEGEVSVEVAYAGRSSFYKTILDKDIVATIDSLGYDGPYEDDSELERYVAQKRIVKTQSDDLRSTDPTPGVETQLTRNRDRSFSLLINWSGKMTISKIRFYVNDEGVESVGKCEDDETTNRYVNPTGAGAILDTLPRTPVAPVVPTMRYISAVTPRYPEAIYEL